MLFVNISSCLSLDETSKNCSRSDDSSLSAISTITKKAASPILTTVLKVVRSNLREKSPPSCGGERCDAQALQQFDFPRLSTANAVAHFIKTEVPIRRAHCQLHPCAARGGHKPRLATGRHGQFSRTVRMNLKSHLLIRVYENRFLPGPPLLRTLNESEWSMSETWLGCTPPNRISFAHHE